MHPDRRSPVVAWWLAAMLGSMLSLGCASAEPQKPARPVCPRADEALAVCVARDD